MLIKDYIKNILTCMVSLHTRIVQGYTGYPKAQNLEDKLNLFVLQSLVKHHCGHEYPIVDHTLMRDKRMIRIEFGNNSMSLDNSNLRCLDIHLDEITLEIIDNAYNHLYNDIMSEEKCHYKRQIECLYNVLCHYNFDNKELNDITIKMSESRGYDSCNFTPILDELCRIVDSVDTLNMVEEKLVRYVDVYETLMQNDGFPLDVREELADSFKQNVMDSIVAINDINSNFPENVLNKLGKIYMKFRENDDAKTKIVKFINNYKLSVGGFNRCRYSFDKLTLKKIENGIISDTCRMESQSISTNITPYYTQALNVNYRNEPQLFYSLNPRMGGYSYDIDGNRYVSYVSLDPRFMDFTSSTDNESEVFGTIEYRRI